MCSCAMKFAEQAWKRRDQCHHAPRPREQTMGPPTDLPVVEHLHTSGSFPLEGQPDHQGVRENRQIGLVHHGEGIRAEHGLPFALAHEHVEERRAAFTFHHATILILKGRNPN